MSDLKMVYDPNLQEGDLVFSDNDLQTEEGLATAVLMSLFTDRRALDDDELPDTRSDDKRGWWGDLIDGITDDLIGSKLWLLSRAKTTPEVLLQAEDYIRESLEWLIDDGIAASIDITVERNENKTDGDRLYALIQINRQEGEVITYKFDDLWEAQINAV